MSESTPTKPAAGASAQDRLTNEFFAFLLFSSDRAAKSLGSTEDANKSSTDLWQSLTETQRGNHRSRATAMLAEGAAYVPGFGALPVKKVAAALREIATIPARLAYPIDGIEQGD